LLDSLLQEKCVVWTILVINQQRMILE